LTAAQLGLDAPGRPAIPATATPPVTPGEAGAASLADLERRMVVDSLTRARGNRSEAARLLGLTRSQLYTRLRRFGLETSER
jgi:DNA-binding NtrC family response regulator